MSTVQTIIDNGFAKSAAARVDSLAAPAELVARVGQCLREVFQVLGRENPHVLGASAAVAFNGIGWSRPADCLRVITVRASAGTLAAPPLTPGREIAVVPFDDQRVAAGKACLTELGQVYIPTGQVMDPSGGTLDLIYARAPIQPTTTVDLIDPLFPAFFEDFLQFDIALYLAMKDDRAADQQLFASNKSAILQQIIEWARGQTYAIVQRFPLVTPPVTNTNGGRQSPADN